MTTASSIRGRGLAQRRRRRQRRQTFSYRKATIVTCWVMIGVCSYGLLGWTWMSIDGQLQHQQEKKQHASLSTSSSPKHQPPTPIINKEEDRGTSRENEDRHLRPFVSFDVNSEKQQQQQQKLWYDRGQNIARAAVGAVQPILSNAMSLFATTATIPKSQPTFSPQPPMPKRSFSSDSSSSKNDQAKNYLRQKTRRFRSKSASQGIIWVLVFPICIILIVLMHRTESYELDDPTIERLFCVRLSRIVSTFRFNMPTSSVTSRSRSAERQRENQSRGDTSNHTPMLLQSLALLNEDRRQRGEEPITLDSLVAFQRVLSDRSLWVGLAERYRLYEQEQEQQQQQQQGWEGMIGNFSRLQSDEDIERQRRHQQLSTKETLEEKCPLWTLDTINSPLRDDECIICLSKFEVNDTLRTLPCQHSFHAGCIDLWMDRSSQCPMCKQSIK